MRRWSLGRALALALLVIACPLASQAPLLSFGMDAGAVVPPTETGKGAGQVVGDKAAGNGTIEPSATADGWPTRARPRAAESRTKPVLYFLHVSKAAGTSFIVDVKAKSGLHSCGARFQLHECIQLSHSSQFLFGTLTRARRGGCDFTACEISYEWAESYHHLEQDGRMRFSVMLRSPERHVLSMYSMCQDARFSRLPKMLGLFKTTTIDEWLAYFVDSDPTKVPGTGMESGKCYFNPYNMMTARLSPFDLDTLTASLNLTVAKARIDAAFHVGVAEEYTASLCLLLKKLGQAPSSCKCDSNKELEVTHTKFRGTNTSGVAESLSALTRELIAGLTELDAELYEYGRRRFERDLRGSGLLCLLKERHDADTDRPDRLL